MCSCLRTLRLASSHTVYVQESCWAVQYVGAPKLCSDLQRKSVCKTCTQQVNIWKLQLQVCMKPSHECAATMSADKRKTHCRHCSQGWEEKQECAPCSDGVLFCMSCTPVICPCCIATPFMLSAQAVLTTAAVTVTGSSFTFRDQRQQHQMQGWPI